MFAVTLAASVWLAGALLAAQITTQYGRKAGRQGTSRPGSGGTFSHGQKARIIPVAIMMDGKFYDAGSYKASPVPMALDFGVVYEAFQSGVSQGTLTITQPGQLNHEWIAEGTWLPAGMKDPKAHKKYEAPVIADDDKDGPPVLHRRAEKTDSDSGRKAMKRGMLGPLRYPVNEEYKIRAEISTTSANPSAPPSAGHPALGNGADIPPKAARLHLAADASKATPAPGRIPTGRTDSAPEADVPIGDPNRPRLRRGKPETTSHQEPYATFEAHPR